MSKALAILMLCARNRKRMISFRVKIQLFQGTLYKFGYFPAKRVKTTQILLPTNRKIKLQVSYLNKHTEKIKQNQILKTFFG